MQSATLVARRKNQEWRGALAVDNDFQDVVIDRHMGNLVSDNLVPLLDILTADEGDRIEITIRLVAGK